MHGGDRNYMRAVFAVKILKVGKMLKIIGVTVAALDDVVGLNIIGKLYDFQRNILFRQGFPLQPQRISACGVGDAATDTVLPESCP